MIPSSGSAGLEDIRDLLGMRTRGAWFILASYITAILIVTMATLRYYTTAWPVVLSTLIVVTATPEFVKLCESRGC